MTKQIDVQANRKARKWSNKELIGRLLWEILRFPFFTCTPRLFWGWRRFVLRAFGAKIGRDVRLHPTVRIAVPWNLEIGDHVGIGENVVLYALGHITIGERATISQYAHLCAGTHDYSIGTMPLLKLPIVVRNDVWICADAFVGPGVNVGTRAVVGARAVVVQDVEDDAIVAGNPARLIKMRAPIS